MLLIVTSGVKAIPACNKRKVGDDDDDMEKSEG